MGARETLTHGRNRLPSSFDSSFKWPLCLARRTPAAARTPLRNHEGKLPANARRPATALPTRGPWLPGGTHQETCEKVYRDRILRGQDAYSTFKLGAIDSDLRTVACVSRYRGAVSCARSRSSGKLGHLVRLPSVWAPWADGSWTEDEYQAGGWQNAAISIQNLSALNLTLGKVDSAITDAEESATRHSSVPWRNSTAPTVLSTFLAPPSSRLAAVSHRPRNEGVPKNHPLCRNTHQSGSGEARCFVSTVAIGLSSSESKAHQVFRLLAEKWRAGQSHCSKRCRQ